MLAARFVPLLAALAVAGSLATKRVAPAGPGTFRTDTPDLRRPPDLRDRDRRRAHVLPRAAARPDRAGPDHGALLTMRRDLSTSLHRHRRATVVFGLVYPLATTGVAQLVFPGQGRRQPGRARRQGGRLAPDRAGLRGRWALLPVAPVGHRLQRQRHLLQQPRPQQQGAERPLRGEPGGLPEARAPLRPGPRARRRAGGRRDHLRLRRGSRTSPRRTRASRPAAWPRSAACRWSACSSWSTRTPTGASSACSASRA